MCWTLAGFAVKTFRRPRGRWKTKVAVGELTTKSDVHWIRRSRFLYKSKKEPMIGYDLGTFEDSDGKKLAKMDFRLTTKNKTRGRAQKSREVESSKSNMVTEIVKATREGMK